MSSRGVGKSGLKLVTRQKRNRNHRQGQKWSRLSYSIFIKECGATDLFGQNCAKLALLQKELMDKFCGTLKSDLRRNY